MPVHRRADQQPNPANPDTYPRRFALCSAEMARLLVAAERDRERSNRKQLVLEEKLKLLGAAFPGLAARPTENTAEKHARWGLLRELLKREVGGLSADQKRIILVDLSFGDPFAPYDLQVGDESFDSAVKEVAATLGLPRSVVDEISAARKDAAKSHARKLRGRHLIYGVLGAGLFAAGGWVFAPALGAALGAGAGLGGIAATNFGLALLGGGSLAAGGAGVAGGMILITGVGAATGGVAATGASVMLAMGAKGTEAELIKLQTTFKAVLLSSQLDRAKAKQVMLDLDKRLREDREQLTKEQQLNDAHSKRVEEVENTIKHVKTALAWMRAQQAA